MKNIWKSIRIWHKTYRLKWNYKFKKKIVAVYTKQMATFNKRHAKWYVELKALGGTFEE